VIINFHKFRVYIFDLGSSLFGSTTLFYS